SNLLKSNCPVTGQPDWASVMISYSGPAIDRASLLRYLVSFRQHRDFHEQCVERIFLDLLRLLGEGRELSVHARYLRRGGLDINPWRSTQPGMRRLARQSSRLGVACSTGSAPRCAGWHRRWGSVRRDPLPAD